MIKECIMAYKDRHWPKSRIRHIAGQWVVIDEPDDPWYVRKLTALRWRVAGLLRKLKQGPKGLVRWWKLSKRCKELNRQLLKEAAKPKPMYETTPKDVEEFVLWAESHGIRFEQQCMKSDQIGRAHV